MRGSNIPVQGSSIAINTLEAALNHLLPARDGVITINDSRVNSSVNPRAIRSSEPRSRIEQGNSTLARIVSPKFILVMELKLTFGNCLG
jgi:hypothetical protein